MERKSKLKNKNGVDSRPNGEEKIDDPLRKLRQMEWMRNKTDRYHVASYQQHSRGDGPDRQKSDKEEDNYYEGTSKMKRERQRKPRPSTSTPSLLSSGFTQSVNTGPPPVNAWQQKKGSALFVKPEEAFIGDEEDYMLKLALEESMRTAENEKKNRDLMKMYNYGEPSSHQSSKDEKVPWGNKPYEKNQRSFDKEIKKPDSLVSSTADTPDNKPSVRRNNPVQRPDLHFVGTADSPNDAHSSIKHNSLKQQDQQFAGTTVSNEEKLYTNTNRPSPTTSNSPQGKLPPPGYIRQNETNTNQEIYHSDLSDYSDYDEDNFEPPKREYTPTNNSGSFRDNISNDRKSISPKTDFTKQNQENASISDLSKGIRSALTFGDTQGLLDDIQEHNLSFSKTLPNYSLGPSRYETNPTNPEPTKTEITQVSTFPSSTETDELLHNFIRKDPPSTIANTVQMTDFDRNPMYPVGGASQFPQRESLHHQLIGDRNLHPGQTKPNDFDSSPPLSNSPSQNTPFGSFENQMTGVAGNMHLQSGQLPFQYPLNFLPTSGGHLQNPLANQNFLSQMPYSNMPPSYGVSNLTNPMLAQTGVTNPNMIPVLNETNPLLGQISAANPNMISPLNDARNNLSMLQAMNQNISALVNPMADAKIMTSLGSTVPNQNMTSSMTVPSQSPSMNPTLISQAANPNMAPSMGNVANKSDLMSLLGTNNPTLDPAAMAALGNQAALVNMVPKVDQSAQMYQAQMMANYNYFTRLQYQAQLAALSGNNTEVNEDSGQDQPQPPYPFVNQSQAFPKEAPQQQFPVQDNSLRNVMENQSKGVIQSSLQTQVQPNQANLNPVQEQMSQSNSFYCDYQTQANMMSQAQAPKDEEFIKMKMQYLAKEFSALQQTLQSKGDNKSMPTPIPVAGQANIAATSEVMPPQPYMYSYGQFVPPVMGIPGYYSMMPTPNTSQLSPNTQQNSQLFNIPSDDSTPGHVRLQQ